MRALLLLMILSSTAPAGVMWRFTATEVAGVPGCYGIVIDDLGDDGRPDIVVAGSQRVIWLENPDWDERPLTSEAGGLWEGQAARLPFGRVNGIRHLAVPGEAIYLQPVEEPDPHQATILVPKPLSAPWKRDQSLSAEAPRLAWADFDGDGSDELVAAGDGIVLHDRDASGQWQEETVAQGDYVAVAVGDLDDDGLADIVAADSSGAVKLLRNVSEPHWRRHVVATGGMNQTAIAADFTSDGKVDVVASFGGQKRTVLYVAPDWKPVVLQTQTAAIHSEVMDVDGDGDPDYIGARYTPGFVFWLETPEDPLQGPWKLHVIDDAADGGLDGVHGLITGDIDGDGRLDLVGNGGQPKGALPNSLAWYEIPDDPRRRWDRHVFAAGDAPGLSHYHGVGDVNGDGRVDIASAAKIGDDGNWFAWWEQPAGPGGGPWTKHVLATGESGATNILIADLNGDGRNDFIGSRGHGRGLIWYENPSWEARQINTELIGPHSLAVGDIDGDGDIDAATCAKDSRTAAWFENDGKGGFETHHIHEDQASYDVRLIDMDGDGDLDLLNAGQMSQNVVWFENRLP